MNRRIFIAKFDSDFNNIWLESFGDSGSLVGVSGSVGGVSTLFGFSEPHFLFLNLANEFSRFTPCVLFKIFVKQILGYLTVRV